MAADITVVIAHRGDPLGLWGSLESCDIEAKAYNIELEYAIVTNGEEKLDIDSRQILKMLKLNTNRLVFHEHLKEPTTPQVARQKAVENSSAPIICFLDNHVILGRDFFKRALLDFEKYETMAELHSCTQYYMDNEICYNYKLRPYADMWGVSDCIPFHNLKPYRISAAGHGGFFVRRKDFNEVNGYYLSSAFKGYAGEELTYSIGSMWMTGKEVWIDPLIIHRHYAAATRGYARHLSPDFFTNLFSVAYILTADTCDKYVYKMLEHFNKSSKPLLEKPLFELMMDAKKRSKPFIDWLKANRIRTFEEQLEYFKVNSIPY